MTYLLHQVKRGRFDRDVVRALLHTLSMFPVGSHVELNDGTKGKVLRSNGKDFMKPVIQKLTDAKGIGIDSPHEMPMLNLADSGYEILRPLPTPNHKEMRLDRELMGRSTLGWS